MPLRLKLAWFLCFVALPGTDGPIRSGLIPHAPNSSPAYALPASEHIDLLVFAPHPDDETLGCAGVILQAVAQGRTVKVVDFTSGDGFPEAAAALTGKPPEKLTPDDFRQLARRRELEVINALEKLGLTSNALVFLGYPDSGLDSLYHHSDQTPFRQKFTDATQTYADVQKDFHLARYGAPAPYTHAAVLADVVELIQSLAPKEIYVTSQFDAHADHQAAYWFVHDGVALTSYQDKFYTYLIHAPVGAENEWAWPHAITPLLPFAVHQFKGMQIPQGLPWPPPRRVPLTRTQAQLKLAAIRAHLSRENAASKKLMPDERGFLESFVKSEEIFWPGGK